DRRDGGRSRPPGRVAAPAPSGSRRRPAPEASGAHGAHRGGGCRSRGGCGMSGSAGAREAAGAEPERLATAAATLTPRPVVRKVPETGAVASIEAPGRVGLTAAPRRVPGVGEIEVRVEG